jgi:FkbM family methyltransferase
MLEALRTVRGAIRSLRIYYGDRPRRAAMHSLYGRFVRQGDLVFDVGAHVGDRTGAFRRLGARVIAAEPQPALATTLRFLYGRDRGVVIERVAIGRSEGEVELMLNVANPTVSTASQLFVAAAKDAQGWEGQKWSKAVSVPMMSLDGLIARHGKPAFIKIDVEGYEEEALAGLSQAVPALSSEFTTIQSDIAHACIERCRALGYARFNVALGESQALIHPAWCTADEMRRWIADLPHAANSGDIYAALAHA